MGTGQKGWQGNFFEDFELGAELPCPTPRTITAGDVSTYIALTGDRTPRFCQSEGYVHPLITFHLVLGQTVRQISLNARANLGYAGMVWRKPVMIGDTIRTKVEILGLKENSSGTTGIAWVRTEARNQHNEAVLEYVRWVMVKKRGSEPTKFADAPVIPDVPDAVDAGQLNAYVGPLTATADTGGRWAYEDYEAGERVVHYDGMTINSSDHMSFTRLFQNSARVHFDEILTDERPLVYGGVPISVAYAHAFNGFENRGGVAAINGGTHANPVYTGDTLYAFTDVVAKSKIAADASFGALRLRLVCVKNENPAELDDPSSFEIASVDPKRGRERHNPNVVLDLDYWELMPLRALLP